MKKWLIAVVIIAAILGLAVAVVFLGGNQFTIARCIVTDNDSLYMVYEDRPIHLVYDTDTNYQTGDKLLILHQSSFAESYPEQTRAYFVMKIASGSKDDIPQKVFDALIATGNRIDSVIPPCTFVAKVVEVHEKQLFVTVTNSGWSSLTEGTPAYVSIPSNDSQTFAVGDYVIVDFDSMVQEIYPPIVPNVYTITKCDSDGNLLQ